MTRQKSPAYRCLRCDRWHHANECQATFLTARPSRRSLILERALTLATLIALAVMLAHGVTQ